ncbi:hypothetical protein [Stappia sp. MMSF_3263]|uniref:hypothetical protein n=1 Tax=Stappia sp. MMSF_3263 TaxID=3046693 RepID=UPI00273F723F|nr:hypothetical protein [Stappia sp. MMSF_3263]
MQAEDSHLGFSLGAIAAVVAIVGLALAAIGKPHWFVAILLVSWLLLWFLAALLMSDTGTRGFLAGTLRHSKYTQIYTRLTRGGVLWVWSRLCDPADDRASWPSLFRAALTTRLYDKALLLAVAYPILLLVGQWVVTGAEGRIGSLPVLPEAEFWSARAALMAVLLILVAGKIGQNLTSASPRPGWSKASGWLFFFAFAFAIVAAVIATGAGPFALAVVIAGVGAFALAGAVVDVDVGASATGTALVGAGTGAGAFAVSGTFAGAVAIAVASAGAGAVAGAVAIEFLDRRGGPAHARVFLTCIVLVALMVAALALDWSAVPDDRRSLFLFLAALPMLNGVFDLVSYALTLSLIRRGLRAQLPVVWGLADLALACLLFLGLGTVLVVAVHGLNLLAGVPFIDLSALFAGIHVDPGAYVWLYLMLFSTVLPTALHGMVSLIGLQGLCPRLLRRWLARSVEAAPESPLHAIAASLGLGLLWTGPVMCLVGVGWIAWHYGKGIILAGLEQYFHLLLWLAAIPIGAI